jgi:hypothetical protein
MTAALADPPCDVLVSQALEGFELDRQPMAVPTRHVPHSLPATQLHATDDILQNLVERMSDMEVAVRIGWTIVQDEWLVGGPFAALPGVKIIGASF